MPSGNMAQSPDTSLPPIKILSALGYGSCASMAKTGLGEALGRGGSEP